MIPLMYDPRPYLEEAKDQLTTSVAFATSRAEDTPRIPLDAYVDSVHRIQRQIDQLIELVDVTESRAREPEAVSTRKGTGS